MIFLRGQSHGERLLRPTIAGNPSFGRPWLALLRTIVIISVVVFVSSSLPASNLANVFPRMLQAVRRTSVGV